jgi:hypothetical protein
MLKALFYLVVSSNVWVARVARLFLPAEISKI